MPWRTRARNSTSSVPATPISSEATTLPASEIRITGRRPWRSERRPHTGAKMSCITAYEAVIRPICTGEAPKSSAHRGRIGRTIPNPIRSIRTVVKTIPSGETKNESPFPSRPARRMDQAASMTRATKIRAR